MKTMITDELISEIADSLLRPGKTFMHAAFVGGGRAFPQPYDNVSRAEFVAMTVRFDALFNDVKKGSCTVKYTDVATNYWAYSDVAYAKHAGWLNGYADGSFKGDNAITRAEVVTVVNRATGRKADEGYITKNVSILNKFTDIRNNSMCYYTDVMEAANTHLANSVNNTETWVK